MVKGKLFKQEHGKEYKKEGDSGRLEECEDVWKWLKSGRQR